MAPASHLGYLADRTGRRSNPFPTRILAGAALLLAFSAGAVLFGQTTGIGVIKHRTGAPAAMRDITLARMADDRVIVRDAVSGQEIVSYRPDEGGFVRGSLRAFVRMRMVANVPETAPYRLIRWEAGTVSLSDTVTGERIYLEAFGKDNAAAFGALLGDQGGTRK
ncbi:phosphonoacetaldehyde hydrolase [Microvirga tunisiensis]|uniref:Phosphonoacetaldehyde hydrolase n=1 Tax=Pannonibacter tanglangensis TaxID=2750084 RepID=A0A7X5J6H7_9HYPH|nr:photosynthetic complex assembly protein PuhC [Pannonibacter sp. XCT-53]NBN76679.1 phosphonoacetaldehyde hydrolase [Pannonibacter sp. XCT-53]